MNNIIKLHINDITPYENNPRHNEEAVEKVANSIKEFGFKQPIVVDKNKIIIAGHTRYKASKLLGLSEVPALIADDLTDEQVKAYRIADNKTAELAEWDVELLRNELEDIEGFTGFDEIEIEGLFREIDIDDFFEESEEKPKEETEEEIQCPHCNMYFKP